MARSTETPVNETPANTHTPPTTRLIPIPQWGAYHPEGPPEGGLRHLRFHCDSNGFKEAFVTIGSRVYIDERKFYECARRQSGRAA